MAFASFGEPAYLADFRSKIHLRAAGQYTVDPLRLAERFGPHRIVLHDIPCRPSGPTTGPTICPTSPYDYTCIDHVSVCQIIAGAESLLPSRRPRHPVRLAACS